VSKSASAIGYLSEEKCKRISSAGGDRGDEGGRDAGHLRSQFLIDIEKEYMGNISRMEDGTSAKNNRM
jgi:hypothetical protein